jgi:hypothetical protein
MGKQKPYSKMANPAVANYERGGSTNEPILVARGYDNEIVTDD